MDQISTLFALLAAIALGYYVRQRSTQMSSVVTKDLDASYDYIVVGAGSAGSVVASRLSEDPNVRVLLLEAGGDYTENSTYHIPVKFFDLQKTESDWEYYTVPQKESHLGMVEQRSYWPRGKVLGGSGIFNSMQYTRGSSKDYDEWADMGCAGWSYEDVLPYFLKSEDMLIENLKDSQYHSTGGYLGISTGGVTPIAGVYLEAGKQMGYNIVDYNGETQEGWSPMQYTIRNGVRSSTSLEFLGRVHGRDNLHVGVNSFVIKVRIENKRATGVYVIRNNRKIFIQAKKEVILSGGAVNSPQLLMLSGIGPASHLKELGIQVHSDLPVGENLQDHLLLHSLSSINTDIGITKDKLESWSTKLKYELFSSGIWAMSGLDGTAFFCSYETGDKNCAADMQFMMFSAYLSDNFFSLKDEVAKEYLGPSSNIPGFSTVISLLNPKSVGTLKLQSDDPFDYPLIDPKYLTDKRDVDAYVRGFRLWEKMIETPAMQNIGANFDKMKLSFCAQH